jgi:hypothetical protein
VLPSLAARRNDVTRAGLWLSLFVGSGGHRGLANAGKGVFPRLSLDLYGTPR